MAIVDPIHAGIEQWLREMPADQFATLVAAVRPPAENWTSASADDATQSQQQSGQQQAAQQPPGTAGAAEAQRRYGKAQR